jgi:uncharacterized protein (TIGR03067 family)
MDEELEKLQGEWNVIFLEVEGMTPAPSAYQGAQIVIKGDQFTSIAVGAKNGGKIELDASTEPKRFRMRFTEGSEKGNANNGIYELERDRWKLCLTITGGPAPTDFTTAPKSGRALEILNRERREAGGVTGYW